jgi:hypothetical protein
MSRTGARASGLRNRAQSLQVEAIGALTSSWNMIILGKPVSTFPDHVLVDAFQCFPHNIFDAMSAPCRIALNFSQTTVGWTSVV